MKNEQKFYVYVDYRKDDGKPFYVGKGITRRIKNLKRNPLHTNIKNKHGIIREIVFESHDEQEVFNKEIQLIQELQTHIDHGNGGANLTLGGDGPSGYKFTEEQREKTSKMNKSSWENLEIRKKRIESCKKTRETPEYKRKISEVNMAKWQNKDYREKTTESLKKSWEDPERKKYASKFRKKYWEDPERRAMMSESVKKQWEDPEYRAMMKEKQRLGREKKKLEKLQQED
jgi:hypothetical protein